MTRKVCISTSTETTDPLILIQLTSTFLTFMFFYIFLSAVILSLLSPCHSVQGLSYSPSSTVLSSNKNTRTIAEKDTRVDHQSVRPSSGSNVVLSTYKQSDVVQSFSDRPCVTGNFLGLMRQETNKFRNHCRKKCKEHSGYNCVRRNAHSFLRVCPEGQTLGFTCGPSCCFWGRCFNMFQPKNGSPPIAQVFWRMYARNRLCPV